MRQIQPKNENAFGELIRPIESALPNLPSGLWLRLLIGLFCVLVLVSEVLADTTSSIAANFNGTSIAAGDTIWFSSVLKPSGLGSNPTTIFVRQSTITFAANGTTYTVSVPDSNITFSPSATSATISFDATKKLWQLVVPSSGLAGNTLLDAAQFVVPSGGLPGGIQNIKWQANFSTDTSGVSMQWQWAAAIYTSFNPSDGGLGVKPVDDNRASQYQNSDHAGTPENYKTYVVGGATGGGGSNYTGSYSGTVSLNVPVVQAPAANPGGPYSAYVSQTISFNGVASSDPSGYPLNYSWNFGDGTTGTGATPTHTYSAAGTFTISLTVDDGRHVTESATTTATLTLPPPPTIFATLSRAPNASGWNNSSVTVTFTCADTNVGVQSCPPPVAVTAQGANQVVEGTATNNAGVKATANVKVSIDETLPTIGVSASPAANSAGWNNTNVTVSFNCSDSLSGVARCPEPILVSSSGPNQMVSGTATDVAGNTSAPASVTLNIELTLPSIAASATPSPNAQGWNNTNVTVGFTCTQSTSPITSCPPSQTVTTEGAGQLVSGSVTDAANNTNTAKVNLNIAKTPPAITAAISPQPNANGWNNSTVTVSFTCTKTTAPLAACPQPQTVATEGPNQAITGAATDAADNSATATAHVYIATKSPMITASVSPEPNAAGWNKSAVTVTFTCTATTAPIASCPQPQTLSMEGASQVVSGTVTDVAGNSATAKVTLNIALTPPTITATASPLPDASGWNNSSVTVSFVCTGTTAPVAICPPPQTIGAEGPGQTVSGTATDVAGNSATATLTINIGTKAPTIVPVISPTPNAAGWNNSNVTISFACAVGTAPVATCPPPVTLGTEGASQTVNGTTVDAAGNTATTSVLLNIDKTPPVISYTISPAPNSSGVNTTTPVTIAFTCSDTLSGVATCSAPITVTTAGMNQVFNGTATDIAGNRATATATINIQAIPPSITASVTPTPNAKGWNNTDPTVTFTCTAGGNPLVSCTSPIVVTTEGKDQSVCGQAIDTTGLSASACAKVSLDMTPPSITVSTQPPVNPNGWFTSPVSVTFSCADSVSGIATCPPAQQFSADGANQSVSGTATDNAGNTATITSYKVSIDQTLPSILQFSAPTQLAPGQGGTATVTATDNIGVASVVFQLNGAPVATLLGPPYTTSFAVPATANPGDTVTLTAVVSDFAGNANSSSRGIQVVAAGVVVGEVLSDVTGLPFEGADVRIVGGDVDDTSDENGRYSIPVNNNHLFLSIGTTPNTTTSVPATVTVEREVSVQTGVGTVPVDARLTALSPAIPINTTGGSLTSGSLTVNVPAGGVASSTNFHLTTLSQQGLPGLLPLGWSPVGAFDLRADASTSTTYNANFSQLPGALTLHLVTYDYSQHGWKMVTPNLGAVNGALTIQLPSVGEYALVAADASNSAIAVPSAGQLLSGVAMVALPANTTTSGSLNPASVAPTGGTSAATLAVLSSTPLPSGTVIQANVTENYALTSGKQLSGQPRTQDILLYQIGAPNGAAVAATFPVTPSETFQPGEVSSGNVHLDLLSGRESVRGQIGGSDAATVQGGDATLTVAAGSLPHNTAISVSPENIDSFLPAAPTLTPLAEYNLDFSGQSLTSPAQLSVAAGSAQQGDNVFLARIQRISGVPYLVVVSSAQVNGSSLVTQATLGLPGIMQDGDFVFYKVSSPTGLVAGTVTASSGPIVAMVHSDSLPFVAFSNFAGSYVLPAASGTVNLTASVPNTALGGSASVQIIAGQTTTANLTVVGQIESAMVMPPNGAVGVPLTAEIDITAPDAFNPGTVSAASVTLVQTGQGTSTPVAVRFVFSQAGTKLAVFPQSALQPSTIYTLSASGLANVLGGLIAVPTVSFTTQANTPPNFNTDALVFGMPDQNGNVAISAPANSFPPGTTILIVDQTNGVVLSLTVGNDGSVSGQFPATIDDVLSVTITAPDKTTTTFTRSQFVAPDGTVAVGSGGGTVTGPGGIELRIPQGALDKGTHFKIETFGPDLFPERPDLPDANFGGGIKITSAEMPKFKKEVKLAFPKPADAPDGSFYYVYRRLQGPNNTYTFETIDHAFVEGTGSSAKVVTGAPLSGLNDSISAFSIDSAGGFVMQSLESQYQFLMWTFDRLLPGVASTGIIAGKALRTVPPQAGQTEPTYVSIPPDSDGSGPQAVVWRTEDTQRKTIARTDVNGRFSLFDPTRGGGTHQITAQVNSETVQATAAELNTAQPDDQFYGIDPAIYQQYRNVGRANPVFAPLKPQALPPTLDIRIFKIDSAGNRTLINGIATTDDTLIFGIKLNPGANASLTMLSVGSQQLTFSNADTGTPRMDFVSTQHFSATSPGNYTVTASALPALGGAPVTENRSFLVIAPGGSVSPDPNNPPTIISEFPRNHSLRVPATILPQVQFSQPVRNVPGNISLIGDDGKQVQLSLSGVGLPDSSGNPVLISSLTSSSTAVTSLTIQPSQGLKFATKYTLTFSSGIVDTTTSARGLVSSPIDFTTDGPQEIGQTPDQFPSARVVVLKNYAYLTHETLNAGGTANNDIRVYDISNPAVLGSPLASQAFPGGHPMDLVGEDVSPVNSDYPVLAVATGIPIGVDSDFAKVFPSSVYVYDVRQPTQLNFMGKVDMTSSATQEGIVIRMATFEDHIYTSTLYKGIQILDLNNAYFTQSSIQRASKFAVPPPSPVTIPVTKNTDGTGTPIILWDLKVGSYKLGVNFKTLVFATGQTGLAVVDTAPTSSGLNPNGNFVLSVGNISGPNSTELDSGRALALGTLGFKNVALIVGLGAGIDPKTQSLLGSAANPVPVLAVVDLTVPSQPTALSIIALPEVGSDVVIRAGDNLALVALATKSLLIDLQDLTNPQIAGEIAGIGGRITITDSNFIFSTAFSPAVQGGIHSATLGSVCASLRATLKKNPPITSLPFPLNDQLGWSMSGGVSAQSPSSGAALTRDGLVLTNIRLGRRKMADMFSLPYIVVRRSDDVPHDPNQLDLQDGFPPRCELASDGSPSCSLLSTATSSLFKLTYTPPNDVFFSIEAQYLIDKLDGDPDHDPDVPDSCIVLSERYEFYKEGLRSLEPFGFFPSAQFRPLVSYSYFTDHGPALTALSTVQRVAFNVNSVVPPDNTGNTLLKSPINDTLLACDPQLDLSFPCLPNPPSLLGLVAGKNPMPKEFYAPIIRGGTMHKFDDGSGFFKTTADNLHFNATPLGSVDAPIDEPGLTAFGCPVCVHVHWRWSSDINNNLTNLASHIAQFDETFDSNKGLPKLPPGSNQDVDVAILKSGDHSEEHPANVWNLYQGAPILPSILQTQSSKVPVFWYIATGHQNSDQFFIHGGGFGTFFVNKIAVENPSTLKLNLEHTRAVDYKIEAVRNDYITTVAPPLPSPILLTSSSPLTGTLPAGSDDLVLSFGDVFFGPSNAIGGMDITISLTDSTLAGTYLGNPTKTVWKRTFHFNGPGAQEP